MPTATIPCQRPDICGVQNHKAGTEAANKCSASSSKAKKTQAEQVSKIKIMPPHGSSKHQSDLDQVVIELNVPVLVNEYDVAREDDRGQPLRNDKGQLLMHHVVERETPDDLMYALGKAYKVLVTLVDDSDPNEPRVRIVGQRGRVLDLLVGEAFADDDNVDDVLEQTSIPENEMEFTTLMQADTISAVTHGQGRKMSFTVIAKQKGKKIATYGSEAEDGRAWTCIASTDGSVAKSVVNNRAVCEVLNAAIDGALAAAASDPEYAPGMQMEASPDSSRQWSITVISGSRPGTPSALVDYHLSNGPISSDLAMANAAQNETE